MNRPSDALAAVLRAGREDFNARFVRARHQCPTLSAEGFAGFLASCADPVVSAVTPESTAAVAAAAYEIGLELVARNLAGPGAKQDAVARAWQGLLSAAAPLVAAAPRRVLGAVSNAVCLLADTPGCRPDWWREEMTRLVPLVGPAGNVENFLRVGQVVAWRAGLAHFRGGARAVLDTLPEPLARAALGVPEGTATPRETLRARLAADPWYVPAAGDGAGRTVVRAGEFRGFGGLFPEPPQVAGGEADQFFVRSGEDCWLLLADAFGATFHRAAPEEFALVASHRAAVPPARVELPFCGEITSRAASRSTLALTGSLTHAVLLVPLPP